MPSMEITEKPAEPIMQKAHALVFASGKAGVGKSSIVANVASALVQKGVRVCVIDAGEGETSVSYLLDVESTLTLDQVVEGKHKVQDVIVANATGVDVVSGAALVAIRGDLSILESQRLLEALSHLESSYDYLLIDTEAGSADSVLQFIETAPFAFLVITAESDSLSDGFLLLRLLSSRSYAGRLRVVVNMAENYPSATETFKRFAKAALKHLGIKVEYGGFVVEDEHMATAAQLQMAVVVVSMMAPASRCLHNLADNVLKHIGGERHKGFAEQWKSRMTQMRHAATQQSHRRVTESESLSIEIPSEFNHSDATAQDAQTEDYGLPPSESLQSVLDQVRRQCDGQQALSQLIGHLVSGFVKDYGMLPQLWSDMPPEAHAPGVDEEVARLLSLAQADQQWLNELIGELRRHYRKIYQCDVFDACQELLAGVQNHDFAEERFEQLLNALRDGFAQQFNKPYRGQSELLLESTAEQLAEMADDEKSLQHEVGRLLKTVEQLSARRELLLTAIGSARDSHLAIKSLSAGHR
jgi:flagellar biosynthesis protein FlhG